MHCEYNHYDHNTTLQPTCRYHTSCKTVKIIGSKDNVTYGYSIP